MPRFISTPSSTIDELQLLSDLHAALDAADTLGLVRVGLRLEQAIAALADRQETEEPSPSVSAS